LYIRTGERVIFGTASTIYQQQTIPQTFAETVAVIVRGLQVKPSKRTINFGRYKNYNPGFR
jgi:hypothetical protein